jgi:hypothetical protein
LTFSGVIGPEASFSGVATRSYTAGVCAGEFSLLNVSQVPARRVVYDAQLFLTYLSRAPIDSGPEVQKVLVIKEGGNLTFSIPGQVDSNQLIPFQPISGFAYTARGALNGSQFQVVASRPPHQLTLAGNLTTIGNATGAFVIEHGDSRSNGTFVLAPRAYTKLQL